MKDSTPCSNSSSPTAPSVKHRPAPPPEPSPRALANVSAQAAIAAKVDGEIVDLNRELPADGEHSFQILTEKDPEALDVLRHSAPTSWPVPSCGSFPDVQLAFGPTVENGFYYDIDSPTPIREEDFPQDRSGDEEDRRESGAIRAIREADGRGRGLCEDLKQKLKVEHIDDDLKKYPS